jgi:hypothetical protein
MHEGLISHGEHLSHRQLADTGVVRRFGLTHSLLRRKDPLGGSDLPTRYCAERTHWIEVD